MTKEIYLSETEYKALETQITNRAMDVRDKLIKEQGESIKELASALKEAATEIDVLTYNFNAGKLHEAGDKFRAIANRYLGNTPPIKEE